MPTVPFLAATYLIFASLAQAATNCGVKSAPSSQYLNASLEYLIRDPFRTPTGLFHSGSSAWKWNIGTVSYNLTDYGKDGSLSQSLWLETESFVDLTSPSLGYTGCGAIMHGLTHAATVNGQADPGDCSLTLSSACAQAIQSSVSSAAAHASNLTNSRASAASVCASLAVPIPSACNAFFTRHAWLQPFAFASPDRSDICPIKPAASTYRTPLASWPPIPARYTAHDMTQYDNLTTAVAPLITAMFTNQTASTTSSFFLAQHLSCLRPANLTQKSTASATIPDDHAPNLNGAILSPTRQASSSSSSSQTVPAVFTGGADELRMMMDWICLIGLSAVLWRVLLV